MKKVILILVSLALLTSPAHAIGDVERGVVIGALGLLGVQHILGHRESVHADGGYREYREYRDYRPRYRYYNPPREHRLECIWVTQYDRYTGEPYGYRKYCR